MISAQQTAGMIILLLLFMDLHMNIYEIPTVS